MKTSLGIIALLVISIFAMAFALADDSVTVEDSIAIETVETTAAVTEAVQPVATDDTLAEVSTETEAIAPSTQAPEAQQRYLGVARATVGDGFVVKSDNTEAKRIAALWVSSKYVSVDPAKLKNLREQYKGQPARLKAEIAKLATDKVVAKAAGRLRVGFGATGANFKLLKKEFTNTSVSFYVLPITEDLAALKDAADSEISAKLVGTMTLDATKYPSLVLWKGTLTLTSGNFVGTWSVTATSNSKVITNVNLRKAKAVVKQGAAGQTGAEQAQTGAEAKSAVQKAKDIAAQKPNLVSKLMFWRKVKANTGAEAA